MSPGCTASPSFFSHLSCGAQDSGASRVVAQESALDLHSSAVPIASLQADSRPLVCTCLHCGVHPRKHCMRHPGARLYNNKTARGVWSPSCCRLPGCHAAAAAGSLQQQLPDAWPIIHVIISCVHTCAHVHMPTCPHSHMPHQHAVRLCKEGGAGLRALGHPAGRGAATAAMQLAERPRGVVPCRPGMASSHQASTGQLVSSPCPNYREHMGAPTTARGVGGDVSKVACILCQRPING